MLIDLHVTLPAGSDRQTILNFLKKAEETGIDGVAFVLNENFNKKDEILSAARESSIKVFFGSEIKTKIGSLIFFPSHPDENLFNKDFKIKEDDEGEIEDIFTKIHAMGGVVVAFHPYDRESGQSFGDKIFNLKNIDALEIHNGSTNRTQDDLAIEASFSMKVSTVGGSGVVKNIPTEFRAATLFLDSVEDQVGLVDSIAKGDIWCVEFISPDDIRKYESDFERRDEKRRFNYRGRMGRNIRDERGRSSRPRMNRGRLGSLRHREEES